MLAETGWISVVDELEVSGSPTAAVVSVGAVGNAAGLSRLTSKLGLSSEDDGGGEDNGEDASPVEDMFGKLVASALRCVDGEMAPDVGECDTVGPAASLFPSPARKEGRTCDDSGVGVEKTCASVNLFLALRFRVAGGFVDTQASAASPSSVSFAGGPKAHLTILSRMLRKGLLMGLSLKDYDKVCGSIDIKIQTGVAFAG